MRLIDMGLLGVFFGLLMFVLEVINRFVGLRVGGGLFLVFLG